MTVEGDDFKGILYAFDSLRRDHVGCYGYDEGTTPTIDRLARDGSRFENAYAQAIWTYPSAGSIFTGLYPATHGSQQVDQPLDTNHPHLADGFANTEVTTACFSTTLGVSPERNYEQGFDEFYHIGDGDAGLRPDIMDLLNDELLPWVEAHADTSFFAVVWAMGTHHPYVTPADTDSPSTPLHSGEVGTAEWMHRLPKEEASRVRSLYDAAIKYSDARLGNLVETLKEADIYEDTMLVVTSDHGEIFDEYARLEHFSDWIKPLIKRVLGADRCRYYGLFEPAAFLGHQSIFPYEELVHVPLVVKPARNHEPLPVTVNSTTELIDLLPTVYRMAGLEPPTAVQGTNVYELVNGDVEREFVFTRSQIHEGQVTYSSVQTNEYKFCRRRLSEFGLSDLLDDPHLKAFVAYVLGANEVLLNLSDEEQRVEDPDMSTGLDEVLQEHLETCEDWQCIESAPEKLAIDEETERTLIDLGYK